MTKWYQDMGDKADVVLSTRIRLARNLKGIPFPGKMSEEDARKVIDLVETALDEMNYTFTRIDLSALTPQEKNKLVEQRYISPAIASSKLPCAAYISEDENVSIMVNEEDHIRIQGIFAGFEGDKAYELISKVDGYLAEKLDYAVHEKYGYLTSCLTNVGTGMRVSYMLHLPGASVSGAAESIFAAVGKLGLTVRGMYGEGTKSSGNIFQISNQTTLGRSENEILSDMKETIGNLIAKEKDLRERIYEQDKVALEDKIMRSHAILKSARMLSGKEMMQRLSDVRLGLGLSLIGDVDYKTLTEIMIIASPGYISVDTGAESPRERDIARADAIRKILS